MTIMPSLIAVLLLTGVVVAMRRIHAVVVHREVGRVGSWMSKRDAAEHAQRESRRDGIGDRHRDGRRDDHQDARLMGPEGDG